MRLKDPTPNPSPEREGDLIEVYLVDFQNLGEGVICVDVCTALRRDKHCIKAG